MIKLLYYPAYLEDESLEETFFFIIIIFCSLPSRGLLLLDHRRLERKVGLPPVRIGPEFGCQWLFALVQTGKISLYLDYAAAASLARRGLQWLVTDLVPLEC